MNRFPNEKILSYIVSCFPEGNKKTQFFHISIGLKQASPAEKCNTDLIKACNCLFLTEKDDPKLPDRL